MGGDPVQQRAVARAGRVPVDAAHVGPPEVVAHEAVRLVVHLPPLGGGSDGDADPGQVDGHRTVRVRRRTWLSAGAIRSRPPLVHQHLGAVAGDREVVDVRGDLLDPQLPQVVALQDGVRRLRLGRGQAGAEHADQRVAQPQHPALGRAQPGVAAGLDREGHDAVGEPFGVDPGRAGPGVLRLLAVLAALGLVPSSPAAASGSSSSSSYGRPCRCGPNGDGVVAASVIRYGRQALGNDRSKTWAS